MSREQSGIPISHKMKHSESFIKHSLDSYKIAGFIEKNDVEKH